MYECRFTYEKMLNITCHWEIANSNKRPLHNFRMSKVQKSDSIKCWWVCGATGALILCWWWCKMAQPLWKTIWQILLKLNIFLPHNYNDYALWYLPKRAANLRSHKNLHVILIAALFTIGKTGKQLRSFSTAEWINKLWHIHRIEYFSIIKNELRYHEKSWKNLKYALVYCIGLYLSGWLHSV